MQGTHFPPECYVPGWQHRSLFCPFIRVQWNFKMEKFASRSLPTLTTESRIFGCGRQSTHYGTVPPRFSGTLFHMACAKIMALMCPPVGGWDHFARRGSGGWSRGGPMMEAPFCALPEHQRTVTGTAKPAVRFIAALAVPKNKNSFYASGLSRAQQRTHMRISDRS